MMTVLILVVFLGVLQLAFALHVRNNLALAASEGARHGARADALPGDAEERALAVARRGIGAGLEISADAHLESAGGAPVVVVEMTAPLPVIGPLGVGESLHARGRAFQESAR